MITAKRQHFFNTAAFVSGVASIFYIIPGVYYPTYGGITDPESDSAVIHSDWQQVGGDVVEAVEELAAGDDQEFAKAS